LLFRKQPKCRRRPAKAHSYEWEFPEEYPSVPYLHRLNRTRLLQGKCRTRLNKTVRPENMSIFAHTITLLILLFITGEFAWTVSVAAKHQHNPAGNISIIAPAFVLLLYLIGVFLENLKNKPKRHWFVIYALIILTIIYPAIIC
jgi:hypothetical protein